jgi:hypothetical protein
MRRAMKVKSKGTEEVIHAVENGEITVNEAERIVELKPHSQRRVVSIKDKNERALTEDEAKLTGVGMPSLATRHLPRSGLDVIDIAGEVM